MGVRKKKTLPWKTTSIKMFGLSIIFVVYGTYFFYIPCWKEGRVGYLDRKLELH
jgi:hypothetical protein